MAVIDTALGRIGLTDQGRGEAEPIIFLHGVGSDKSVWRPQLDHFSKSRRAIAFDYPGYGESEFVAGATRDDYAAAILAALDALGIGRAHICGLSLGGIVAMAIHRAAPARCASLIIADSFAVHPDGQAIHDRSVAASIDIGMAALAEARAPALLGEGACEEVRAEVVATMSRIDPAAYRLAAAAVWLADLRDAARAITGPALVMVGDEDRVTPPGLSGELAGLIEDASLERITGAGHLANIEQPDRFNSAVDRFLRNIDRNS
jgi:3-oxoadipate enol-lactonase